MGKESCVSSWSGFGNQNAQKQGRLQRVVDTPVFITGTDLTTSKGIHRRLCLKELADIKDSHHTGHPFSLLPQSGRLYRNLKTGQKAQGLFLLHNHQAIEH